MWRFKCVLAIVSTVRLHEWVNGVGDHAVHPINFDAADGEVHLVHVPAKHFGRPQPLLKREFHLAISSFCIEWGHSVYRLARLADGRKPGAGDRMRTGVEMLSPPTTHVHHRSLLTPLANIDLISCERLITVASK